jgi:hypothetical protein
MSKQFLVYSAPVATRSGYGDHARDILRSLRDLDKFDIQIVSQKWGSTPMNALDKNDEFHSWILEHLANFKDGKLQLPKQPDVWIQVTVPNEFQRLGKWNVGITAGIETTAVSSEWVQGMNRMDMNIVPSNHAKEAFLQSVYTMKDETTGQEKQLKIEKPIEVLFEGFNESIFTDKSHKLDDTLLVDEISKVKENFAFLFVGHWLKGDFGHDRKDVATMIRTFCETFKTTSNPPALILKTSSATFSVMDREEMINKIKSIKDMFSGVTPNIYLLHGDLSEKEMNNLYNHPKVKAMVTFTKGEGFGRPLLEFTQTGKPLIATAWSGHMDFLDKEHALLLGGQIQNVHQSAVWDKVIIPESKWLYVDVNHGKKAFKEVFKNYKKYKKNAEILSKKNKKFTLSKMTEKLGEIIDSNIPEFPKEIQLNLPNLPKLKKVE